MNGIAHCRNEKAAYFVPDVSSRHCRAAIQAEVTAVAGVRSVELDLETKVVRVVGCALDDTAIRNAIHDAGYAAAVNAERGGDPMSRIRRVWRYIVDRPLV